jgi:hypothetical protein
VIELKIKVYLKRFNKSCYGLYDTNDKTILVQVGSEISLSIAKHFIKTGYFKKRNKLFDSDIIDGNVFASDYLFDKPSAASSIILGSNSNGNVEWVTTDGKLLDELTDDEYVSYKDKDKMSLIGDLVMICKLEAEEELQKIKVEFDNLVHNISDQSELNHLIELRDRLNKLEKWEPTLENIQQKVKDLYETYILAKGAE